MSSQTATPLSSLRIEKHRIPPHPSLAIPNSSATGKPLLLHRHAFPNLPQPSNQAAKTIETHLRQTGVVEPQWRYTMYRTTHFHSTTHEVLCVFRGKARLLFGGEGNPGAVEVTVAKGDMIVVPAGVGHRLLEDLSSSSSDRSTAEGEGEGGFQMVGAYPVGSENWDMCYGKEGEEGKVEGIKVLGWFERDPIYGEKGPVLEV